MAWVLDLDGVVWRGDQALPGAADAVARLRAAGERVLFVTNNSYAAAATTEAKLARMGIPAAGDVVTSAMAGAALVEPGERVLVCGGPGIAEAVTGRGAEPVLNRGTDDGVGEVDVVMVGYHRDFDYERLRVAATAVMDGATLIGTNDDPTYPTPAGPVPGGGAILAAVATASGVTPVVAGKPHRAMADVVRERVREREGGADDDGVVVGDRPSTDGRFARALGYRFALVMSGVTTADDLPVDPGADLMAADLAELVAGLPG
jgi:HAD superfamily hydrolase (TIGR01450 family)